MRDEDLAVIRAGYEAFAATDWDALTRILHRDVELETYSDGTFRGHDGVRRWMASLDDAFDDWRVEVEEVADAGAAVLVSVVLSGRSRLNRIDTSLRFWIVWQLRDGKAWRGRHHTDRDSALAYAEGLA